MTEVDINRKFQSLNELLDTRIKHSPEGKAVTFIHHSDGDKTKATNEDGLLFNEHSILQFGILIDRTAFELSKQFPPRQAKQDPLRVIALFTKSDFDALVNLSAIIRLGHAGLLLSLNNSVDGVIHLMKKMKCKDIVYSQERQEFINELGRNLEQDHKVNLQSRLWIESDQIASTTIQPDQTSFRSNLSYEEENDDVVLIMHSSGSTGLPKPLPITNKALCTNFVGARTGGISTLPLFHVAGIQTAYISIQILSPIYMIPSTFSQTSTNLLKLARAGVQIKCFALFCVPLTLKLLNEIPTGKEVLAKYPMIAIMGSPCPKALGDRLVEAGVNLTTHLGSTEAGYTMTSVRDYGNDKEWQVLRPRGNFGDFLHFEIVEDLGKVDGQPIAEMIVKKGWPPLVATNRPDGGYATSDLFVLHPTIPKGATYLSRRDDALVHVNGEKTNPLLIEQDLRTSNLIKDVLVFGAGKMHTGCLLIPYDEKTTIDDLWPAITGANKNAQTHSRLMKEMVVILSPSDTFITTDKKSIIRFRTLQKYQAIVDKTYKNFEEGDGSTQVQVKDLTQSHTIIRSIVYKVLEEQETKCTTAQTIKIKDDDNLFDHGLDSLAVIRIGNLIKRQVKFPNNVQFSDSAAFQYPTIHTLAEYVFKLVSGVQNGVLGDFEEEEILNKMKSLLDSYTEQIQSRTSTKPNGHHQNGFDEKQTILLTGATGALGAHLLTNLVKFQNVSSIICFCRSSSDEEARVRVEKSLQDRKLDSLEQLEKSNDCMIDCLKSDLTDNHLGLQSEQFSSLLTNVTSIIHAAWPVNFSMGIDAFQSSLQGCLNLINLASSSHRSSPPNIIFCSSIAAVGQQLDKQKGPILEKESNSTLDAISSGYGQSKWVAEGIFTNSPSKIEGLQVTIARIGQLCGDLENGIWNESEAYPLLIKSATTIGSLPNLSHHQLYWLPVDVAAKMIGTLSSGQENSLRIVQIASGEATGWNAIFKSVQTKYPKVTQISINDWVEQLSQHQDPKSNPAIKLLDYYKTWISTEENQTNDSILTNGKMDTTNLNTILAKQNPGLLEQAGQLNEKSLDRMINAWQISGFLPNQS